jgi:predicted lipoprotein with Yx(FWY)xxD motif
MRTALIALTAVAMGMACGGPGGTASNTPAAPAGTVIVDIRSADVTSVVPSPSPGAAAASPVVAQPMTMTFLVGAGSAGKYKSQVGMTLYTYTPDAMGKVACVAACAAAWPPLLLPSGTPASKTGLTGKLSTIDGPNGRQVTYNGWPLYFWKNDNQPGDTTGQYFAKVWFVAVV